MNNETHRERPIVYEADLYIHCYPIRKQLEHYLLENCEAWKTEMTTAHVEPPHNQKQLLAALEEMFEDDEEMGSHLAYNLNIMNHFSRNNFYSDGFLVTSKYDERTGCPVSMNRYEAEQPNLMIEGLLEATGARCLRDDRTSGGIIGTRVHKGKFEGNDVFFWDELSGGLSQRPGKMKQTYCYTRILQLVSEDSAIELLDRLSQHDRRALREMGLGYPFVQMDPTESLSRSDIAEVVQYLIRE